MRTKAGSSLALPKCQKKSAHGALYEKVESGLKNFFSHAIIYLIFLKLCTKNELTKGHVSQRSEMKL